MKTLENWKKEIVESLIDNRTHFVSTCPICGDSQQTTVDSSGAIAQVAAIGKIVSHIKAEHPHSIKDD